MGHPAADLPILEARGKLERMGKEAISQEHGDGITPFRVGGGLPASGVRSVQDIVVHQRGRMDEFENHRQIEMAGIDIARGAAREESQRWAQALPVTLDGIGNVALDRGVEGSGLLPNSLLNRVKLRIDQL